MPTAIIHGVFDEAGKFNDHNIVSICGWISRLEHWEVFGLDWSRAMDQAQIAELHTTEFMDLHGQYFELRDKWGEHADNKKYEVLSHCVDIIRKNAEHGIGVAIDAKHLRLMTQKDRDKIGNDPFYMAFQEVLNQAMVHVEAFAKSSGLNVGLGLIFDQDERQSLEAVKLLNKIKKERKDIRDRITGICFCDRRKYNPIQAADFIAYEAKKELERRIYSPHKPISPWFDALSCRNEQHRLDGFFNGRIFDARALDYEASL